MTTGIMLNDRETILRFIKKVVSDSEELKSRVVSFKKDDILFEQGKSLDFLYLLLEGKVKLNHTRMDGSSFDLVELEPGHFVGLISFTTGNASLTTGSVLEDITALRIEQDEFEQYVNDHPRLRHPLQQLMMNNMTDRFLQNVKLEAQMNTLNKRLEQESLELKEAYQQLEDSHQKLVHQEKMATLGELVAGFAHEVNNPAAALLRCSEMLKDNFSELKSGEPLEMMFNYGLNAEPVSSSDTRDKMPVIEKRFPTLKDRSQYRKLAQMPEEALKTLEDSLKDHSIEALIQQFDAGKQIHNIEIASTRIANLVKSLKSYSRQDHRDAGMIDIREGMKDTILILSNRLKYMDVQLDLEDIPLTCAKMGELNQVWTNILVNACDVLDDGGSIFIKCQQEGRNIVIEISDNGPGIPKDIIDRIFEPNFTTKNQGAKFGLGLGLAISSEIVKQHGGTIKAGNREEGGAQFLISLPIKEC